MMYSFVVATVLFCISLKKFVDGQDIHVLSVHSLHPLQCSLSLLDPADNDLHNFKDQVLGVFFYQQHPPRSHVDTSSDMNFYRFGGKLDDLAVDVDVNDFTSFWFGVTEIQLLRRDEEILIASRFTARQLAQHWASIATNLAVNDDDEDCAGRPIDTPRQPPLPRRVVTIDSAHPLIHRCHLVEAVTWQQLYDYPIPRVMLPNGNLVAWSRGGLVTVEVQVRDTRPYAVGGTIGPSVATRIVDNSPTIVMSVQQPFGHVPHTQRCRLESPMADCDADWFVLMSEQQTAVLSSPTDVLVSVLRDMFYDPVCRHLEVVYGFDASVFPHALFVRDEKHFQDMEHRAKRQSDEIQLLWDFLRLDRLLLLGEGHMYDMPDSDFVRSVIARLRESPADSGFLSFATTLV